MDLGTFSISLAVKDLDTSRSFYEKLGFTAIDGSHKQDAGAMPPGLGWCVLDNDGAKIGLFMGMFKDNVLTFNPSDVRGIQATLKDAGVGFVQEAEAGEGPASATLLDPDGNAILIDQH